MRHRYRSAAAVIAATVMGGAGIAVAATGVTHPAASATTMDSQAAGPSQAERVKALSAAVQSMAANTDQLNHRLAKARADLARELQEMQHQRAVAQAKVVAQAKAVAQAAAQASAAAAAQSAAAPPATSATTGASGGGSAPPTHTSTGASGGGSAPPTHTSTGASGGGAPPTHTRTGASGGGAPPTHTSTGASGGAGGGDEGGRDD